MTSRTPQRVADLDTHFEILSNEHRRRVLLALLERDSRNELPRVPDDIPLQGDDPESLRIRMAHSHLPKLDAAGFVDWDRETDAVQPGPRFEECRPLLEAIVGHGDGRLDD